MMEEVFLLFPSEFSLKCKSLLVCKALLLLPLFSSAQIIPQHRSAHCPLVSLMFSQRIQGCLGISISAEKIQGSRE